MTKVCHMTSVHLPEDALSTYSGQAPIHSQTSGVFFVFPLWVCGSRDLREATAPGYPEKDRGQAGF